MSQSNSVASVRQRLKNLAKDRDEDFQLLLTRYMNERLLYRLSQSTYKNTFVLKGAMLFSVWMDTPHRATRDIDLLGSGEITEAHLIQVFSELARIEHEDCVSFDAGTVQVSPIRTDNIYGGLRVTFQGKLGNARIPLQVDVGIGDAHMTAEVEVPTLLSHPAPRLSAYVKETVIAEKLEATVKLGTHNSRMKDFYDLATLGATFPFDGPIVRAALIDTFFRRNTELPVRPLRALLQELAEEQSTPIQWKAFQRKAAPRNSWSLDETLTRVTSFAEEPLAAAAHGKDFEKSWSPGGPWHEKAHQK